MSKPLVLVVDDVEDICEVVGFYVESAITAEVVFATSMQQALQILAERSISVIISDYNMPGGTGGDLFKAVRKTHPELPFFIHTSDEIHEKPEFAGAQYLYHLPKPIDEAKFATLLTSSIESQPGSAGPSQPKNSEYVPIKTSLLLRLGEIPCSLFVKINEGFVKVAHSGANFDESEYKKYQAKNVHFLFIQRAEVHNFAISFSARAFAEGTLKSSPTESRISIASASIDFLRAAHQQFGFTQVTQELTEKNIKMISHLMEQAPQLKDALVRFKDTSNSFYADHCTLVALLTATIAKELHWVSDITTQKLAFAAVLHDATLPMELIEDKDTLRKAIDPKFEADPLVLALRQHPITAQTLVQKWHLCPPDVDTIIVQHHERPEGNGFPYRINHLRISPMSAVFIFCHDLTECFLGSPTGKARDYLTFMEPIYSRGEFKKIIEATKTILQRNGL